MAISARVLAYHGTTAGLFASFTPRIRRGEQLGFGSHFAADRKFAEYYATDPTVARRGKQPVLYTVELTFKKLLVCSQVVVEGSLEFALGKRLAGSKAVTLRDEKGRKCMWLQTAIDSATPERALKLLSEAGYDGLAYEARVGGRPGPGGYAFVQGRSLSFVSLDPSTIRILHHEHLVPSADAKVTDVAALPKTVWEYLEKSITCDASGRPEPLYRPVSGSNSCRLYSLDGARAVPSTGLAGASESSVDIVPMLASICNPFATSDSPRLSLDLLSEKLGRSEMVRIATKFITDIERTEQWQESATTSGRSTLADVLAASPQELRTLTIGACQFFDDISEVDKLAALGFDGASYMGTGATAHEREYRVFSQTQLTAFPPGTPTPVTAAYRDLLLSMTSTTYDLVNSTEPSNLIDISAPAENEVPLDKVSKSPTNGRRQGFSKPPKV